MRSCSPKVLVTGGSGLIGSAVVHALNMRGIDQILLCDLRGDPLKETNLRALKFQDFIEGPMLRQRIERSDTFFDVDTVIHLGACSSTLERNLAYLADNNLRFTQELAEWSLRGGRRFVYASSAATYGDRGESPDDRDENLRQWVPLNPYGDSKHQFDLLAQERGWLQQITGLKYFNVFGPNEQHKGEMRSVVSKAYDQVKATGRVRLFKSYRSDFRDGEQRRDFLYVKDAAEMTLHFALAPQPIGGLFNCGSGTSRTWVDLARALFAALDLAPQIDFVEMPESLRGQYQYLTEARINKLRATGFDRPITTLEEAVSDYVRNYLVPDRRLGE